jgi:alkylhydroperoxidase family enzyme
LVQAVLENYQSSPLTFEQKALFAFVDKVNRTSNQIRQKDVDEVKLAGWSDEAIYDAITVCSLFNFYNRWIDATGVQDMPAESYQMSGVRMAERGYVKE